MVVNNGVYLCLKPEVVDMSHLIRDRNYEQLLIACFPSKLCVLSVKCVLESPFPDARVVVLLISRTC